MIFSVTEKESLWKEPLPSAESAISPQNPISSLSKWISGVKAKTIPKLWPMLHQRSKPVCNAAVSAGHSKDALKTINFGVSSEYDSVRNSKGTYQRVFVGYNCSYNTRLSFDFDRDMLERTLNAIAESKAEPELSIRFTVRDGSAVKSALLKAAAENAREKAQILCRASGVELGRAVQPSTTIGVKSI